MSKFKVGDKVIRTQGDFLGMFRGDADTVTHIRYDGSLNLEYYGEGHDASQFIKVVQAVPAQENGSADASDWSYAEASRLQALAHAAIDQYNEYVQAKPSTVFLTILK